MATTQRSHAVAVFDSRAQAERAVQELRRAGFRDDEIALVMHHRDKDTVEVTDLDAAKAADVTGESKAAEGVAVGAVAGAVVGGLLALVPGAIVGVGAVLTLGTLAGALFGVTAGAAGGGLVGALVGADFPEGEARYYEQELKAGKVLVGAKTGARYDEAQAILRGAGGYDATTPRALPASPVSTTPTV